MTEKSEPLILLDLLMPNGKKIRECTAGELEDCAGFLLEIAKTIREREADEDEGEKSVRELAELMKNSITRREV